MNDERKKSAAALFTKRQSEICAGLEEIDGGAKFRSDFWTRGKEPEAGGGGHTRVMLRGKVFEQGGVNFSEVYGSLPPEMGRKLIDEDRSTQFHATGVSLVLHPISPIVPTVHANFRYLEVEGHAWFGGGMDLTPYVLFEEDAAHFHTTLKTACDRTDAGFYPKFKKWCDDYFYIPHRGETRGIGGVFFDYLGRDSAADLSTVFSFVEDISGVFLQAYGPIVERRKNSSWTQEQREFQLWRRGRYAEFNLVYDRGTQFGLATGGRTESILMSLPPYARWEYGYQPTREEEVKLIGILKNPVAWA